MWFVSLVLSVLAFSAAQALAQAPAPCERTGNLVCQAQSSALQPLTITFPRGDITIVRNATAITPIANQALRAGDRIVVGQGSANVFLTPACVIGVTDNATAAIVTVDGKTCIDLTQRVVEIPKVEPSSNMGKVALGVAAAAGLGAGAYFLTQ